MDVLILDDQEWTISKLVETLREGGARIDYASTLEDALEYFSENEYHAIITDFHIDDLDGKRFLEIVRGYDEESFDDIEDPDISTVVATAFADMQTYKDSVAKNRYAQRVLFSSHEYGDGCSQDIPEDVYVAVKNNEDPSDYTSERSIAEHLGITLDDYWEPEDGCAPVDETLISDYSIQTALPPQLEADMDEHSKKDNSTD
ncbi:MAG: response regulator [Candidatus Woesearchaeota archaeon]